MAEKFFNIFGRIFFVRDVDNAADFSSERGVGERLRILFSSVD